MAQSDEEKYKGNEKVLKQLDVVKRKELELAEFKKAQKNLDKETQESNKKWIEAKQANLNIEKQTLGYFKQQAQEAKKINDGFLGATKSFARLSSNVRKSLSENKSGGGAYLGILSDINTLEQAKFDLSDEQITKNVENASFAKTITDSLLQQAEATETARAALFGQTKLEQKIEEIEQRRAELGDTLTNKLIHAVHLTEELEHKEERLKEIKEGQKELYEAAPDSLKSAIGFAQKLGKAMLAGAGPIVLIASLLAAGLESFLELDKAAEDYRKTSGMTVKQTEHLAHQAHEIEVSLRGAGVELKHVFDVANDLANVFGDMTHFSTQTLAALGGIQARTGTTSETAAKVQGIFEQVAGVSGETAASLQMQVASLAQQGKVSPKEVLEDIAENAEATSKFFKGDVNALKAQVIQAHQLGTTLTKVAKVAEDLLDFEGGIEDELVAATYVGGQFNLSRARALAYENDLIGAQKETLKQLNQGVGFKNQDLFTQKALAKAANMSIEDINKQLLMEEKLGHLSGQELKDAEAAVSAGLDLTNINEDQLKQKTDEFIKGQEIAGQVTEMGNMFKSIVATVGGALVPLFSAIGPILEIAMKPIQLIASIINEVISNMYILLPLLLTMGARFLFSANAAGVLGYKLLWAQAKAVGTAIASIFTGQSILGPYGIPVAIAAVAGMLSMIGKAKNVGDLKMPAGQGPTVTTAEGAIYKGTKNDDVAMAPGITAQLDNAAKRNNGGGVSVSSNSDSKYMALLGRVDTLMQKLTTGGIVAHAYMDTSKVTANVANNSNNNTRNNFAFGQG